MSECQSYRIFLYTSQKLIVTKTKEFSSRGHCYVDLTVLQIVFGDPVKRHKVNWNIVNKQRI